MKAPRTHAELDEAVNRMERELVTERIRVDRLVTQQEKIDRELNDETSRLQELKRRAEEAISEFDGTADNHLRAATRILTEAVKRANDPQNAAMEQAHQREIARDRAEQRKFIVQLVAMALTTATTISAGYFVTRTGSHEGAQKALSEQHLIMNAK